MAKKAIDKDMPVGRLKRVDDFLPPPDKLVLPDEAVKVTLYLKKSSVQFFKKQARRYNTKYQRMIREVVDRYATRYGK